MAFLPDTPLTLKGGCFCSAIKYTVNIPSLEHRPNAPGALPCPIPADSTYKPSKESEAMKTGARSVPTRFPLIEFDHCHSCRRACGSVLQCWLICETSWVDFDLLPRDLDLNSTGHIKEEQQKKMKRYPTTEVVNPSIDLQSKTYVGHYSSNGESERMFCTRCGTPMTFYFSGSRGAAWKLDPVVDIALGTLDQESLDMDGVRPERHGWWEDGTPWVKEVLYKGTGGLVRHPTGRPGAVLEEDKHLLESVS